MVKQKLTWVHNLDSLLNVSSYTKVCFRGLLWKSYITYFTGEKGLNRINFPIQLVSVISSHSVFSTQH